ncbi:immunoglobulin-like domain-containing protein [Arthrobacter sp. ISL-28]|uniref:immunoglobulin-like domain-containing protein n=1 Tax=Arthrobacter sp. ISL-28 TaxID=2819108 RepID=UPI001BECF2C0|nr:immunoglobulin-like domain-containing protein [Arthrobacter sp. ISL-28]MBT2521054.1 family 43 glycosylhydrolase [Arthrobacter sp. ISL-28]
MPFTPFRARTGPAALTAAVLGLGGLAASTPAQAAIDDGLVLKYNLTEPTGAVAEDTSGNGHNGVISGDASRLGGEGLQLGGTNGHVRLPNDIMRGLNSITVSTDVKLASDQPAPYFIWGLGNTTNGVGNGYLFTTGNSYRTSIASGNWSTEQTASAGRDLARGAWKTITYTLAGGTAVLYEDGVEVARKSGVTITPGSIGGGTTTANYLGRSVYSGDKYLKGQVRDFRVYNRALSAAEVRELGYVSPEERVALDLQDLALGDTSAITGGLKLPLTGPNGSAYTWSSSNEAVVSSTGAVTRPAYGTGNAEVTLTATATLGEASASKTFTVTVIEDISDEQKVSEASAALTIWHAEGIRGNITLPTRGLHGTTVEWKSGDESVITAGGEVTRPAYGNEPVKLNLHAFVSYGKTKVKRSFRATVLPLPKAEAKEGYAFAYFTGNDIAGENIFMAASRGNDALKWDELNGGQPVLKSGLGTKGLRDPFIIRSPEGDKFYMIATDLSIGSGTSWDASQRMGSQHLEVWESTDLVNWSEQRHVKVSPDTAGNTWAPEAHYDEKIGAYVVYWASKIYADNDPNHAGGTHNKMMYSTTRDFRTFSEAKVWNDPGNSVIDSTVIKEGGTYYRFSKDEARVSGCLDIMQEKSTDLLAVDLPTTNPRNWSLMANCIGKNAGTGGVEGPTIFKSNTEEKYYLFVDEFGGRGYIPLESTSLENPNWKLSSNYELPRAPRHGTVLPVTKTELERLHSQLG